jgi:hypothetical protein
VSTVKCGRGNVPVEHVRILLLHLDGKLPNIALMRVAAHHRALGDVVELRHAPTVSSVEPELLDQHDKVYASCIFERTRPVAERVLAAHPGAIVGGTGWRRAGALEDIGIETKAQDYSIYPRFRPSIGFLQRGCRLKCEFCVVPGKEGAARDEQSVEQLWRGVGHPRDLLLLDNDFFGAPGWRASVESMRTGPFRVCFSQGINARMISDEAAKAIASVDYRDDSFKVKRIYTAWDNRKDEGVLFRGLDRLAAAGVKPDHVMVYILVGYWAGETHEDRDYRRRRLREWGARPYPMPFVRTPELVNFQRWVIGAYDKRISWPDWCSAKGQPRNLQQGSTQRALPLFASDAN